MGPIATEPQVDTGQDTTDPVLRTKLYRCQLPLGLVHRERLLEMMDRASEAPLTLISAPAGYGKSVVVGHWIERRRERAVWLSLDESDGEVRTFLRYLLVALDDLAPGACASLAALLASAVPPSIDALAAHLGNGLDSLESDCYIVLDDYHRIDQLSPVHELLTRLLEHPPRPAHLVLVTRQDPPLALAGLRGRGQLNEVRLEDLRFNDFETAEFMTRATPLRLDEERLANLHQAVEGWAVGLQLVSLALRHTSDPDALLGELRGGLPYTQEYLMQEVLSNQSAEVQTLLLTCSILDRFCTRLLDHMCGEEHPELDAPRLMSELQTCNLFVLCLDDQGEWFRFHHLFQELLRGELERTEGEARSRALHQKAGEWFAGEGSVGEAVGHFLAAGDDERAARLVERDARRVLGEGRWYALERRMALLPETVIQQRPLLLLGRAFRHYYHMEFSSLPALLDRMEELLGRRPGMDDMAGEIAMFRAYCALIENDPAGCLELVERAYAVPGFSALPTRFLADLFYGLAGHFEGQGKKTGKFLDQALSRGDLEPMREAVLVEAQLFIAYMSADPTGVAPLIRRGRRLAAASELKNTTPWIDWVEGAFCLQRGHAGEAIRHLEAAGEARDYHHIRGAVDGACALALAYELNGQSELAATTLRSTAEFVDSREPSLAVIVRSCEVRVALLRGESESAEHWLLTDRPPVAGPMFFWVEVPSVTWCRALIAEGSAARLHEAEQLLREHIEATEGDHNTCHLIEVLSLLALVHEERGEAEEAGKVLERALRLAKPGDFVLSFSEPGAPMAALLARLAPSSETAAHFERTLYRIPKDRRRTESAPRVSEPSSAPRSAALDGAAPRHADSLTNRELDVVELLADRLQDKEIASILGISPSTVKDHLKHIYQKLDVHDRRQAVRRAMELGILGPHSPDWVPSPRT